MNQYVKSILYVLLLTCTIVFGALGRTQYNRFMTDAKVSDSEDHIHSGGQFGKIIYLGGAFFVSVVGLGIMLAHDFSHLVGAKVAKILHNDEGESIKKSDYEVAEQIWTDGNPLEAIKLMRDYLQKNPKEQHVAIRIAEIYEKDLDNPLAAALEYEEVLKQKLAAEKWGWTAIHLCNIYFKLDKAGKAIALLHRINNEFPDTPPAEKARKRLEAEGEIVVVDESEAKPQPIQQSPINANLQAQFEKFHKKTHSDKNTPEA